MFLPSFVPRPLEQLPSELDEVKVLVHQENALAQQEVAVREHHKDAPPLGIVEVCVAVLPALNWHGGVLGAALGWVGVLAAVLADPLGVGLTFHILQVCEDLQSEPADTDDSEPDLSDADDMDDGAEADDLVEEREAEGDEGADIDDPGEPDFGSDGSGSPYVPPSVESVKRVPGTAFIVDGFRFPSPNCRAYFLTHAHSDHTTGLSRAWDAGPVYCSAVTARILQHDMGIPRDRLHVLPLDTPTWIAGVEVTAIDANHCPGAVMLLFRIAATPGQSGTHEDSMRSSGDSSRAQAGTVVLHTGDFRWRPAMAEHPALKRTRVDFLMLDTTYCAPKWTFPPQDDVVAQLAELMAREVEEHPRTLFLISSYHVGKERAYLGAAARLGWRVWAPPTKRRLLHLLDLPPSWLALLAEREEEALVHVAGGGAQMRPAALAEQLALGSSPWDRIVAVWATGWTYRRGGKLDVREEGPVKIWGLPYSEHSSCEELRDCVRTLRPRRLIPTVNADNPAASRQDAAWQEPSAVKLASELAALGDSRAVSTLLFQQECSSPQQQQEQQRQQQGPGTTVPSSSMAVEGGEEEEVDLSAVDVAQQHRILSAIRDEQRRQARRTSGGARRLRQGSLAGFVRRTSSRGGGEGAK
eukprot:scaffold14.g1128.t1